LGLAATLWATLIGQSVPQLLSTENSQRREFRSRVEAVCRDMQEWTTSRGENSFAGLMGAFPHDADIEHPGVRGVYGAEASWAQITAPTVYASEYLEFRQGWTAAFGTMYFDFPGRNALSVALARWRAARRAAPQRLDRNRARSASARRRVNEAVFQIDRDLGKVTVASIAMSMPPCQHTAEALRDAVADTAPA
jgi:hypothetical protein